MLQEGWAYYAKVVDSANKEIADDAKRAEKMLKESNQEAKRLVLLERLGVIDEVKKKVSRTRPRRKAT